MPNVPSPWPVLARDDALDLDEFARSSQDSASRAKAERLFEAKDANGDAKLTAAEFKANNPKVAFLNHDLDGDGGLNVEEFHQHDMHWASLERAEKTFAVVDRDDDGKVSFEELRGRSSKAWFLRSDADGDDRLSAEEYGNVNPNLKKINRHQVVFEAIDRDGDGGVSFEEFDHKSQEALFLKRDGDGDDKLSLGEYRAWLRTPEQRADAEKAFQQKDADADGSLTLDEYTRRDE